MAAIKQGNRQQVEQADGQRQDRDDRYQPVRRVLGDIAENLANADRPRNLISRNTACEQLLQGRAGVCDPEPSFGGPEPNRIDQAIGLKPDILGIARPAEPHASDTFLPGCRLFHLSAGGGVDRHPGTVALNLESQRNIGRHDDDPGHVLE